MDYGIPSVTLEIGNPQVITKGFVNAAYEGVGNVLSFLNMTRTMPMPHSINPVLCARSYWYVLFLSLPSPCLILSPSSLFTLFLPPSLT